MRNIGLGIVAWNNKGEICQYYVCTRYVNLWCGVAFFFIKE